ncbi:MAG: hypothetical protein Q8882_05205 [Bacillota bacterium]|nr:hypothetical protein [Bacillota bacterium]
MKIGLLPLYIKLYDDVAYESFRKRLEPFYEKIAEKLKGEGFEVIKSSFCRLKDEFETAVKDFENCGAKCIVTLHMAYSPSLESASVLAKTYLPIVVLDTTETFDFSPEQNSEEINFCHGIHGVMDMCNLLKRNHKIYAIAAGHYEKSDVIKRCAGFVRAAAGVSSLKNSKTGSIGGSFDGMGDFLISDKEIKNTFGVEVVYSDGKELAKLVSSVADKEINEEIEKDNAIFIKTGEISEQSYRETVRSCLAVRKWIKNHNLSAFTVNFLEIRPENGITIMPFMEACKEMAAGVGYAGEGDVLTASITGALLRSFEKASFVEIFCPDWKNNTLFLSHMGEMNYALAVGKPEMKEIKFIYGQSSANPVVGYGCYKAGKAVFANVYRDAEKFNLLIAPVEMLQPDKTDNFGGIIRGWMKPEIPVHEFLEKISKAGATHHSSLVYDATVEQLEYFGELLGLNVVKVGI